MEFWSGILGAIVGGAIALIGTIFSSVYSYRCQRESEQRQEKRRIYLDICSILGRIYNVSVIVDLDSAQNAYGKIDTTHFGKILDELNTYIANHTGEMYLYLPNDIYSALMRIRADIYNMTIVGSNDSLQSVVSDFDLIKNTIMKVGDLETRIKNDLYPQNRKNKRGR